MKTRMGFSYVSREMWDAWITSDAYTSPEQLYRPALRLFTAAMVLAVQNRGKCVIVKGYDVLNEHAPIADEIACERLVLGHHETQRWERPISAKEMVEKGGKLAALESLLLPHKGGQWCIAVTDVQLLLPIPRTRTEIDDTDRAILNMLYNGFSGKEIGQQLGFSHRTIEHRIERLKRGFGARTIAQLVALSIACSLGSAVESRGARRTTGQRVILNGG